MQRIRAFESLRGLLALWVIAYHVALTAGLHPEAWPFALRLLGKGESAVEVFIILSGFVIFARLDNSRETYGAFLVRRAFRLYPVYLICLALSAALTPFFISTLKLLPWSATSASRLKIFGDSLHFFWPQMAAHVALLHGVVPERLLPSSDYAFIGQAWSISLEWQFYLIAPLYYKWISEKKIARVALLSLLLTGALYFFPGGDAFLPKNGHLFFAGAVCYYGYRFVAARKARLAPSAPWIVALPIVSALLWTSSASLILFAAVYSLVLGVVLLPRNRMILAASRFFDNGILLYLGRISYCLYLTHMIFLYVCARFLVRESGNPWLFFAALLASVLVCALPASAILSRWIEYPLLNFGKRVTRARTAGRLPVL